MVTVIGVVYHPEALGANEIVCEIVGCPLSIGRVLVVGCIRLPARSSAESTNVCSASAVTTVDVAVLAG